MITTEIEKVETTVLNEVLNEIVISEGDNLKSVLVNHEGKEQVISTGNCPVCDKVITFTLDIVNRDRAEELAGSIYQMFLLNHEVCLSCRMIFEKWCKEHKEFCDRKHLSYREVGNKLLEKQGKKPIIGLNLVPFEEEVTEEVASPSIPEVNSKVTNGND